MKKLFIITLILFISACTPSSDPEGLFVITIINDGYGDYVLVPAGEFEMGEGEVGMTWSAPVHTVHLDSFYIGKYEVTNEEYKKFIDDEGYTNESYWSAGGFGKFKDMPSLWPIDSYHGGGVPGFENFPVDGVSWYESMAYCAWLTAKTGKVFRLPTEAEWEKAARGTDLRSYPWGDNIDSTYSNYSRSSDPYVSSTPVGYYDGSTQDGFVTHDNSSLYGAYDMSGNVYEWCSDWLDAYSADSQNSNPTGPDTGKYKVFRGGGWMNEKSHASTYIRNYDKPEIREPSTGFRCVREK